MAIFQLFYINIIKDLHLRQNNSSNKHHDYSNKQHYYSNKQHNSSNKQHNSPDKQTLCQQDYCNREIHTNSNLRQTLLQIKKNIVEKNKKYENNINFEQDQSYKYIINCKNAKVKFMTATECKANMYNNN